MAPDADAKKPALPVFDLERLQTRFPDFFDQMSHPTPSLEALTQSIADAFGLVRLAEHAFSAEFVRDNANSDEFNALQYGVLNDIAIPVSGYGEVHALGNLLRKTSQICDSLKKARSVSAKVRRTPKQQAELDKYTFMFKGESWMDWRKFRTTLLEDDDGPLYIFDRDTMSYVLVKEPELGWTQRQLTRKKKRKRISRDTDEHSADDPTTAKVDVHSKLSQLAQHRAKVKRRLIAYGSDKDVEITNNTNINNMQDIEVSMRRASLLDSELAQSIKNKLKRPIDALLGIETWWLKSNLTMNETENLSPETDIMEWIRTNLSSSVPDRSFYARLLLVRQQQKACNAHNRQLKISELKQALSLNCSSPTVASYLKLGRLAEDLANTFGYGIILCSTQLQFPRLASEMKSEMALVHTILIDELTVHTKGLRSVIGTISEVALCKRYNLSYEMAREGAKSDYSSLREQYHAKLVSEDTLVEQPVMSRSSSMIKVMKGTVEDGLHKQGSTRLKTLPPAPSSTTIPAVESECKGAAEALIFLQNSGSEPPTPELPSEGTTPELRSLEQRSD